MLNNEVLSYGIGKIPSVTSVLSAQKQVIEQVIELTSDIENFFGILKQEMYSGITYYSFDELKDAIEKYIKYYNEKQIKKTRMDESF